MKSKLIKIVVVLAVVGLMSVGPAAYAMPEEDNPESGQGNKNMGPPGLTEELQLTPSQKEAFMALNDPAQQERSKDIAVRMKTKMQALDTAVTEPGVMLTDVSDLIEEIGALYTQLLSQKMDHLFAMKKLLTPEQFAKMQEWDKQQMNMKSQGRGVNNQGQDQEGSGAKNQGQDQEGSGAKNQGRNQKGSGAKNSRQGQY